MQTVWVICDTEENLIEKIYSSRQSAARYIWNLIYPLRDLSKPKNIQRFQEFYKNFGDGSMYEWQWEEREVED